MGATKRNIRSSSDQSYSNNEIEKIRAGNLVEANRLVTEAVRINKAYHERLLEIKDRELRAAVRKK